MSASPSPARRSSRGGPDPALSETPPQAFRRGMVQALPFLLVLIPFGMLFGVVAQAAGMRVVETMGFSIVVLAGASQFAAMELMAQNAPVLLILASALAVNLRMAMYSASLVPHFGDAKPWERALIAYCLVDQGYAMAIQNAEAHPGLSTRQKVAHFFGASLVLCPPWFLFTYLGATAGNFIPAAWPLDFAVPITFLSMVAPMLRTLAHLAAAAASILLALALAGLPSGSGLLIAAPLGMAVGAWVETLTARRANRLNYPVKRAGR
ncbi:AzlC family ABC transporter permease [Paracoccus sp. Z118]|nr:AzlC family ABC transporter permease [Paracoccus sp. Z118]